MTIKIDLAHYCLNPFAGIVTVEGRCRLPDGVEPRISADDVGFGDLAWTRLRGSTWSYSGSYATHYGGGIENRIERLHVALGKLGAVTCRVDVIKYTTDDELEDHEEIPVNASAVLVCREGVPVAVEHDGTRDPAEEELIVRDLRAIFGSDIGIGPWEPSPRTDKRLVRADVVKWAPSYGNDETTSEGDEDDDDKGNDEEGEDYLEAMHALALTCFDADRAIAPSLESPENGAFAIEGRARFPEGATLPTSFDQGRGRINWHDRERFTATAGGNPPDDSTIPDLNGEDGIAEIEIIAGLLALALEDTGCEAHRIDRYGWIADPGADQRSARRATPWLLESRFGRAIVEGMARYPMGAPFPLEVACGITFTWEGERFTATTGPIEAQDLGGVRDDVVGALGCNVYRITSIRWEPIPGGEQTASAGAVDFDANLPVSVTCPVDTVNDVVGELRTIFGDRLQIGPWSPMPEGAVREVRAELRLADVGSAS